MPGQASRENGKKGGRPKGSKDPHTIEKEEARAALRQIILQRMDRMTAAQINNAEGIRHLMLRDPDTGQFKRMTSSGDTAVDEAQIDAAVAMGKSACWIYLKDPSIQAYTDLMNRALDKPKEQAQELQITGSLDIVATLAKRHKSAD